MHVQNVVRILSILFVVGFLFLINVSFHSTEASAIPGITLSKFHICSYSYKQATTPFITATSTISCPDAYFKAETQLTPMCMGILYQLPCPYPNICQPIHGTQQTTAKHYGPCAVTHNGNEPDTYAASMAITCQQKCG